MTLIFHDSEVSFACKASDLMGCRYIQSLSIECKNINEELILSLTESNTLKHLALEKTSLKKELVSALKNHDSIKFRFFVSNLLPLTSDTEDDNYLYVYNDDDRNDGDYGDDGGWDDGGIASGGGFSWGS
jgi:hypothetical protein